MLNPSLRRADRVLWSESSKYPLTCQCMLNTFGAPLTTEIVIWKFYC